jgi:hypothetical protein
MTEKEQIKAEIEGRIALAEKCAEAACEKNLHSALEANEMLIRQYKSLLAFIESLPDENNPEPYNPVYDEDYLNEKIAKATKSWEGVDADKMLAESRGIEEKPSGDLEKAAENIYKTPFGTRAEDFQAGAEWQAKQGYSLEYVIQYAWGVSDTSTESKKATLSFPLPADIFEGDHVIIQIRKK